MSSDDELSEEHLNAFVDGELDSGDRGRVLRAIGTNPALQRHVGELRRLRDLLQYAYYDPPHPAGGSEAQPTLRAARLPRALRSSAYLPRFAWSTVALAIGVLLGWVAHPRNAALPDTAAQAGLWSFEAARVDGAPVDSRHVVLHVSSDDPRTLDAVLVAARRIVSDLERKGGRLVILANGGGINLLRSDIGSWSAQVQQLLKQHSNLTVIACSNGVEKLIHDGHQPVQLIPGATVGGTAVEEIVARLREGWVYVKV